MKLEFLPCTDRLGDKTVLTLLKIEEGDSVRIHPHIWVSVLYNRVLEPTMFWVASRFHRVRGFFGRGADENAGDIQSSARSMRSRRRRENASKALGFFARFLSFPKKRLLPYSGNGFIIRNFGKELCITIDISPEEKYVSIFPAEIAVSWKTGDTKLAWSDESFVLPRNTTPCRVFSGSGTVISVVGLGWAEKTVPPGESFSVSPYVVISYRSRKDFVPAIENGRISFPEHSRVWYISESEVARARRSIREDEGKEGFCAQDIGNAYPSVVRI